MNRRQSIKALSVTALGAGLLLDACKTDTKKATNEVDHTNLEYAAGLQDFEKERLAQLYAQPNFFTPHERETLIVLCDLIIPADDHSGSASDAGVIDFIEFIVKDIPSHQLPLRGGLKWLDVQCYERYGKSFLGASKDQQTALLELIAYPGKTPPELQQGEEFFNRVRNLTASGFYTSKIGIKDLGYVGNTPNKWKGVPDDVLKQYGLEGI